MARPSAPISLPVSAECPFPLRQCLCNALVSNHWYGLLEARSVQDLCMGVWATRNARQSMMLPLTRLQGCTTSVLPAQLCSRAQGLRFSSAKLTDGGCPPIIACSIAILLLSTSGPMPLYSMCTYMCGAAPEGRLPIIDIGSSAGCQTERLPKPAHGTVTSACLAHTCNQSIHNLLLC